MYRPEVIPTLLPGGTSTNLDWIGRRRNGFTWRVAIRNGFGGRESVHILVRRSRRWCRFGGRLGGWRDLSGNCVTRESMRATWLLGAEWEGGTRARSLGRGR